MLTLNCPESKLKCKFISLYTKTTLISSYLYPIIQMDDNDNEEGEQEDRLTKKQLKKNLNKLKDK